MSPWDMMQWTTITLRREPQTPGVPMEHGRITAGLRRSRRQHQLPLLYFLASARFIEKKNLPRLIEAYARYRILAQSRKQVTGQQIWDLVLLGDGPLRPHCAPNSTLLDCMLAFTFAAFSITKNCRSFTVWLMLSFTPARPNSGVS